MNEWMDGGVGGSFCFCRLLLYLDLAQVMSSGGEEEEATRVFGLRGKVNWEGGLCHAGGKWDTAE